jgi:hypothetical protein
LLIKALQPELLSRRSGESDFATRKWSSMH